MSLLCWSFSLHSCMWRQPSSHSCRSSCIPHFMAVAVRMRVFARLWAFFALRPLGRRVPGGGDAGSLLPGVLPPELGATVMIYRQRSLINTPSEPQPPQPSQHHNHLATVTHHSFGKVGTTHAALRGHKQGTRTVQGEEHELYHAAKFRTTPLPPGGRPAPLSEVAGWQVKVARHTGQLIDDLPYVQILDTPVPQMVDSAMDFFVAWTCRLPSRLSTCPLSPRRHPVLLVWLFPSRSWWNSWWKCRLCCLLPFSNSGLPSSSVLRFRVVERCSWRSLRPLPGTGLISGF